MVFGEGTHRSRSVEALKLALIRDGRLETSRASGATGYLLREGRAGFCYCFGVYGKGGDERRSA